jgi:peroxiredoxin
VRLRACFSSLLRSGVVCVQLSDKNAELATALGVAKQSGALTRSGRYAALINDNKVVAFNAADAGGGMECTLANALYAAL